MIYFIRDKGTGHIKIGYTKSNVVARLATMQTGCPTVLVLLFAYDGDRLEEAALHKSLAASRVRGEWFEATAEVLGVIEIIKSYQLFCLTRSDARKARRRMMLEEEIASADL